MRASNFTFGKFSKLAYLIVNNVPVKHVEFIVCHGVKELVNDGNGNKMARRIDQHSSERETREIVDSSLARRLVT